MPGWAEPNGLVHDLVKNCGDFLTKQFFAWIWLKITGYFKPNGSLSRFGLKYCRFLNPNEMGRCETGEFPGIGIIEYI
jgi:hypothetical protein